MCSCLGGTLDLCGLVWFRSGATSNLKVWSNNTSLLRVVVSGLELMSALLCDMWCISRHHRSVRFIPVGQTTEGNVEETRDGRNVDGSMCEYWLVAGYWARLCSGSLLDQSNHPQDSRNLGETIGTLSCTRSSR